MGKKGKKKDSSDQLKTSLLTINAKFLFFIGILLLLLIGSVAWLVASQEKKELGRQVSERAGTIVRNLAANAEEALLLGDELVLALLVKESVQTEQAEDLGRLSFVDRAIRDFTSSSGGSVGIKNAGVTRAFVTSKSGAIIADTSGDIGLEFIRPTYEDVGRDEPYPVFRTEDGVLIYEVQQEIMQGGQQVGEAILYLRRDTITNVVRQAVTKMIGFMILFALAGMLLLYMIIRSLLKPVSHLVGGVRAVAEGDFTKQISLKKRDELGELIDAYNDMAGNLLQKERIQEALSKYTSKELVDQMLTDKNKLSIGGERVRGTVFFSILPVLHHLSSSMDADKYVGLVNNYLEIETEAIIRNKGQVDKFMGDEVMALWGLGEPSPDDNYNAVKAGIEIQAGIAKLNAEREARGEDPYLVSIGINQGSMVAGNMGSSVKMDYTVLGAAVNLAARLGMVAAKQGQTICSKGVAESLADKIRFEELPAVPLKGIKEPVPLFWAKEVIG